MSNELIILEKLNAVELFKSDEAVNNILGKIEEEAKSIVQDISTESGRKEIASMAYKVARTKTALDNLGKDLTETARQQINAVNAGRKEIRDRLDALKDEVRKPLTDFENAEKERVACHEEIISRINDAHLFRGEMSITVEVIEERINDVAKAYNRDWEEFFNRAENAYNESMDRLGKMMSDRKQYDEEQAELERLRKEQADREKKEREERIAKEAAEKAKREAEEKAKAEKERIEQEKRDAEEKLKYAKERQAQLKKEAEQARKDALAKAEKDKKDAIEAERKRIEYEKKAEDEAKTKREADKKHRAKINNEILEDLQANINLTDGCPFKQLVVAMAQGKIRNVSIEY